jgi:hypothetical protein
MQFSIFQPFDRKKGGSEGGGSIHLHINQYVMMKNMVKTGVFLIKKGPRTPRNWSKWRERKRIGFRKKAKTGI